MHKPRLSALTAVGVLAGTLALGPAAHADGWHDHDGYGPLGFIAGLVTGAVVAPYVAAPPPVVYAPPGYVYGPPRYVYAPPQPVFAPGYVYGPGPVYRWHRGDDDRRHWEGGDDR